MQSCWHGGHKTANNIVQPLVLDKKSCWKPQYKNKRLKSARTKIYVRRLKSEDSQDKRQILSSLSLWWCWHEAGIRIIWTGLSVLGLGITATSNLILLYHESHVSCDTTPYDTNDWWVSYWPVARVEWWRALLLSPDGDVAHPVLPLQDGLLLPLLRPAHPDQDMTLISKTSTSEGINNLSHFA